MKQVFSEEQNALIAKGKLHSAVLSHWVGEAIQAIRNPVVAKRHWYIQSAPGLGKTYTVQAAARNNRISLVMIQGSSSLAAFVRQVTFAVFSMQPTAKKPLFFCIDDCDELFTDRTSLNVMKGILDEERNILSWEVDMTGQISKYRKSDSSITNNIADALELFQSSGGVGIQVPIDHCVFIILSNKKLASDKEGTSTPRLMREAAIRSRVQYRPINIIDKEYWGWAAATILNENILGNDYSLTPKQTHILLNWMYDNWDNLPGSDLREVKGLAAEMINHPKDYMSRWTIRLIR